jgi:histone acetyltransferase (RNA polymerase elongator complex component)
MNPNNRIIPIFVPHLGCPNACVFCNQRKISGSLVPADRQTVVKAVEAAKQLNIGQAELAFYGGSFTAIDKEQQLSLLEAAQPYIKEGFISSIRLSTRPDKLDTEALTLLSSYGVKTIELGTQSMDEAVLKASGRGHSTEDTINAAKLIKEAGFRLILQMMTGLPGSNADSDIETAHKICSLRPDGVRIYPTVIVKDTELYELWKKGLYKEHTIEAAVLVCAQIVQQFEKAGIPIIRLGLNPTDDLSGGEAAGGAYHPALGQLVYSRIYLEKAQELIRARLPLKEIEIKVHKSSISLMVGQKRENISRLKAEFNLKKIKVSAFEEETGRSRIEIIRIS